MRFSLAFFLLAGCPAKDSAEDTSATGITDTQETALPQDGDGDGFAEEEDCDDTDPAIHPGAAEVCDGLDNDCDGEIDVGAADASNWYADGDGDGYGLDSDSVRACDAPSGHVEVDGDCDDSNAAVHPGAEESDCTDPVDYNCDGSVGYADEDGDGAPACEDCDDADAALSVSTPETCDGLDNDCDGTVDNDASDATTWYGDADGDGYGGTQFTVVGCDNPGGYVTNSDDCNDVDATSHPGAAEVCDNADNDCDGDVDEGVRVTWYADADGDGFGDSSTTQDACNQPPGYSSNGDDCDDTNVQVSPAATEVCDSVDNDCDGIVDDGAVDASTWYADSDGDGHGDAGTSAVACTAPSGHVATDDDCDDANGAVHPSASEICDTIDNDCDGDTDEDDATDATTWYGDLDGDGYGGTWSTTTSCSQPTGYVANADDCDDLESLSFPGTVEICDGKDNDCDGTIDEEEDLQSGSGNTWYADVDGDGYGDATAPTVSCSQPVNYVSNTADCDDGDGAISPLATEICDGIDNDCDGDIDDGDGNLDATTRSTWYLDSDGDLYGNANVSVDACDQPSSYVADATDCDDVTTATNPGATETCNSVDDDCDGTVDEADASDATTWYEDADSDTYGNSASSTVACDQPTGFVTDATDCDDAANGVNTGATETCDGVDNNCSGTIDDDNLVFGDAAQCAASSCLAILTVRSTASDGNYVLDPNGGGTSDAFSVACDMTGGGYTLLKLYGGRTSRNSYSDCSPYSGYGTNDYMGQGHFSSCSGNQVEVTWHDVNNVAIPADQITALNAAGLTSRSTPNWVRDADGNIDDVFFCMGNTQVGQWAWSPKSQSGDNSCFETSNGAVTLVFNKWSASTGAQESGQNWMMERDWYFQ
jgi:hypothetical protein